MFVEWLRCNSDRCNFPVAAQWLWSLQSIFLCTKILSHNFQPRCLMNPPHSVRWQPLGDTSLSSMINHGGSFAVLYQSGFGLIYSMYLSWLWFIFVRSYNCIPQRDCVKNMQQFLSVCTHWGIRRVKITRETFGIHCSTVTSKWWGMSPAESLSFLGMSLIGVKG